MAVINGGYAKITRQVYEVEFRGADGCAWGDYAYASNSREACRIVARDKRNMDGKIVRVVSEYDMGPSRREQAQDWLHGRNGY